MKTRILIVGAVLLISLGCSSPFAAQVFKTPTPAVTSTPTATPTVTPTPTLPPTPTPLPAVRINNADQLVFNGDYESARREYQNALATSSDPEVQAAANLGMAHALYLQHNYSTAIDQLKSTIASAPKSSPHLASAYFFLAECLLATDQYDLAAGAYGKYLELRPGVLDAYIQELRGDAFTAAGNSQSAIDAYQAAIAAPQDGVTTWTELKLGKAYSAKGDFSNAIKTYLAVYQNSNNDYARAQANFLMGQTYLSMGMTEQANARFMDNIASFPKSYDTYSGLVQLINNGATVSDYSRGLVDYYAGQYGLAIDALNRYIETNPGAGAAAYYFRALSRMAMNEPGNAITDLDTIIEKFRDDNLWADAWDEKAYIQWYEMNKFDDAAQTLLKFIEVAPASSRAPDMLYQAGRIQERGNQLTEAAATWERMIDSYPSNDQSYRALFLAGVTYYRAMDYAKALTVFQRVLVLGASPSDQAAAYLWIGKTQKALGSDKDARAAWEQGAQRDPTGYYSVRCNELLQSQTPFEVTRPIDLGYDLNQERGQAESWMRTTFELAPDTDLSGLGDLASDPHILRGKAFWELGLLNEARNEYETLRQSLTGDAVKTYRLMNDMLSMGLYRSAILASRQILDLANLDDVGTLKAPSYFNHIRFGVYFKDQILQASQNQNINPLFLLSVLRQESMFEGFAVSGAGARGLMQIMPATGQEIASNLQWPPDYTDDDLFRPAISIPMGASYLARQRDYFGGSLVTTLSAYNGGPGNTTYWNDLSKGDTDLFLEVIRADETRKYITQIYEFFNIYRLLYERGM